MTDLSQIVCPACGDRETDHTPFGQPPVDGDPLIACICDCGALFLVRLLREGPVVLPIGEEQLRLIARQPAFAEMLLAWERRQQ